jgi:hypothetical protein
MSAQVCPVCGGKGLVPKGFYDVSSNLGSIYKTTSITPETCRSCRGKGYIIEYPSCEIPVYNTFKKGCFTCVNNDHRTYVSIDDDGICTDRYKCMLDHKKYPRHHCCSEYKYDNS